MPETAVFSPDLFGFLGQLKRHNNREWFAKNKARYPQVVVESAMQFARALDIIQGGLRLRSLPSESTGQFVANIPPAFWSP